MIDGGHVANAPLPTLLIAARQAFDSIGRRFPWQVRSQFATLQKTEINVGQWIVNCATCPNRSTRIARLSSRKNGTVCRIY